MSRRRTYSAVSGIDITPKFMICSGSGDYKPSSTSSYNLSKNLLLIYEIGVDYPIALFDASELYYNTTSYYVDYNITRNYDTDLLYINSAGNSTYNCNRLTYTYNPSTNVFTKLFDTTASTTDSTYRVVGVDCRGNLIKFSNSNSKLLIGSTYISVSGYADGSLNKFEVRGDDIIVNNNLLIDSDYNLHYTEFSPSSFGSAQYKTDSSGTTITWYGAAISSSRPCIMI